MNPTDILAYLYVLDSKKVKLTEYELKIGQEHCLGCLSRIEAQLDKVNPQIANLIRQREELNGKLPKNDPQLVEATDRYEILLRNLYSP